MTEEAQLKQLQLGLQAWATANKGTVHIAHDVPHLFRILGDNPGLPRIGILLVEEKPRNEQFSDVESRMDRKFWVAISRGYTLERYAGKSLVDGVAGGLPMFTLLRNVRDAIRSLRFDMADEPVAYYHGYELLTFEGITLDAYRLEFVICTENNIEVDPVNDPQYE